MLSLYIAQQLQGLRVATCETSSMPKRKPEEAIDVLSGDEHYDEANKKSRLVFKDDDDLILLRQVIADKPFAVGYGKLQSAWQEVANKCCTLELFTWCEAGLKGSTARKRFDKLMANFEPDEAASEVNVFLCNT